jgi:hypothetical protein
MFLSVIDCLQVLAERVLSHSKIKVRWDSEVVSFQVQMMKSLDFDQKMKIDKLNMHQGKKVRVLSNGLQVLK